MRLLSCLLFWDTHCDTLQAVTCWNVLSTASIYISENVMFCAVNVKCFFLTDCKHTSLNLSSHSHMLCLLSCFRAVVWPVNTEVATPTSASLWLKTRPLWSSRLTFGHWPRSTNLQQQGLLKMQGATQLQRNQLSALDRLPVAMMTITRMRRKEQGQQPLSIWQKCACLLTGLHLIPGDIVSVQTAIWISCRERGQPYFLYVALAHMHVPLAPPLSAACHTGDSGVYAASLREMDALIGAVKTISDETDRNNTLIWFTG